MKLSLKPFTIILSTIALAATGYAASDTLLDISPFDQDSAYNKATETGYEIKDDTVFVYTDFGWNNLVSLDQSKYKAIVLANDIEFEQQNYIERELNIPFDAKGHTMSSFLYSLFTKIGTGGSVSNLKLYEVDPQGSSPMHLFGIHCGSITAENHGKISNRAVYANCTAYLENALALLSDSNQYVAYGGVVGVNYGTIENIYANCCLNLAQLSGSEINASYHPTHVFIGGVVGCNEKDGVVNNVFCDYVRPSDTEKIDYQGNIHSMDFSTVFSEENVSFSYHAAEDVGFDNNVTSHVTNIFCTNGVVDADSLAIKYIPPVFPEGPEIEFYYTHQMTPLPAKIPTHAQLAFSNNDEWTFNYSYFHIDSTSSKTTIFYRAPIPLMGKTQNLGSLKVNGGVATVTSNDDWNHLSDALDQLQVSQIVLTQDIVEDSTALLPIYSVRNLQNVVVDGNGHTLSLSGLLDFNWDLAQSYALFDSIGTGAVVKNFFFDGSQTHVHNEYSSSYGLLTKVNRGEIKNCYFIGSVTNDLSSFPRYFIQDPPEIALGGLVGVNDGKISNLYASIQNELIGYQNYGLEINSFCVGGLVGKNTANGSITDVVLDVIETTEIDGVKNQKAITPLTLGEGDSISVSVEVDYNTTPTEFGIGCLVGVNNGSISNVYCPRGTLSYIDKVQYTYPLNNPFRIYGYRPLSKDYQLVYTCEQPRQNDYKLLTEFDKKWPYASDLAKIFAAPEDWGFDLLSNVRSESIAYRAPVPSFMAQDTEDILSQIQLDDDGIALISDVTDWNNTAQALADVITDIKGIKILNDIESDDLNANTLPYLDVTLDGAGHSINVYPTLVDSIAPTGAVKNLYIPRTYINVTAAQFGGLARVNYGLVEAVRQEATLYVDLANSLDDQDIAIGGLLAHNYGTVKSSTVADFLSVTLNNGVSLQHPIHSMSFANGVALNHEGATIEDCFISKAQHFSTGYTLIDIAAGGAVIAFPADGTKPALGIGALTALNDGVVSSNLCSMNMFDDEATSWSPEFSLTLESVSTTDGNVQYTYGNWAWCDADATLQEVSEDEELAIDQIHWTLDESLLLFNDPSRWTFNCPADRDNLDSDVASRFPVPNMLPRILDAEPDPETQNLNIEVNDSTDLRGVFDLLSDANTTIFNASLINISSDIDFTTQDLDFESLTASNISQVLDSLPQIGQFSGTLNGSNISNLQTQTAGLFGTLTDSAKVNDLVLSDAVFYVDPTDPSYLRSNDTIFVSLFARELYGQMNNIGLSGVVIVDDSKLSQIGDSTVVIVLIGESSAQSITGFIYLDETITPAGTKKMIPMKQNLCTGKYQKLQKAKVALRRDASNKSLPDFDPEEPRFLNFECAFSDEEYASGLVAHWLNYDGPGFTGNYTAHWAQGTRVPVSSGSPDKALYKVEISCDEMDKILEYPIYANGQSQITLKFSEAPSSIKSGDKPIAVSGTEATFTFEGGSTIKVSFAPSALETIDAESLAIAVNGQSITFTGADGLDKDVYDVAGRLVARTSGDKLTLAPGLYIVRCADIARRIVVK